MLVAFLGVLSCGRSVIGDLNLLGYGRSVSPRHLPVCTYALCGQVSQL